MKNRLSYSEKYVAIAASGFVKAAFHSPENKCSIEEYGYYIHSCIVSSMSPLKLSKIKSDRKRMFFLFSHDGKENISTAYMPLATWDGRTRIPNVSHDFLRHRNPNQPWLGSSYGPIPSPQQEVDQIWARGMLKVHKILPVLVSVSNRLHPRTRSI
jgi:hypothetical protein